MTWGSRKGKKKSKTKLDHSHNSAQTSFPILPQNLTPFLEEHHIPEVGKNAVCKCASKTEPSMIQLNTGLGGHRAMPTYLQCFGTALQKCALFHRLNCPEMQDILVEANHANPALLLLDWSWLASSLLGAQAGQLWCVSTCPCYLRACLLQTSHEESRKSCCQHCTNASSTMHTAAFTGNLGSLRRVYNSLRLFIFYLKTHTKQFSQNNTQCWTMLSIQHQHLGANSHWYNLRDINWTEFLLHTV